MVPWTRRALLRAGRAAALSATAPAWRAFEASAAAPDAAQEAVLRRALAALARTRYGARWGARRSDSYADFAAKLPLATYEDLRPWVREQQESESRALVPGATRFYERTSGSSGGAKDVPYGDLLWASFQGAFAVWLHDLLARGPRLETGRTWISVSPWTEPGRETALGVRVGLDDDGEYVRGWLGSLLRRFWTVPSCVRGLTAPEDYKRAVSAFLLADPDLEALSLWNPTLGLSMLDTMHRRREDLLEDLSRGETRGLPLPRPSPRRLSVLKGALADADWAAVWPRLKLVSAWDMGEAARPAAALREAFPGAFFQGKGHLATEAPVTVPVIGAGHVPVLDQVFFEFEAPGGRIRRLHELSEGLEYALIVTPPGGFARYRLGDRVRVTGRWKGTPTLELAGRADAVSDLCGEKLHEGFVAAALDAIGVSAGFRTLLPVRGAPARYALLVDRIEGRPEAVAQRLDAALRRSPLYEHARAMGQLGMPTVGAAPDAAERFARRLGGRWGGVKPAALLRDAEKGSLLAEETGL
jgi:hypothetical protein